VADCAGLENQCARKGTQGSNPCLSAERAEARKSRFLKDFEPCHSTQSSVVPEFLPVTLRSGAHEGSCGRNRRQGRGLGGALHSPSSNVRRTGRPCPSTTPAAVWASCTPNGLQRVVNDPPEPLTTNESTRDSAALMISQDLFFSSKVTSTANELGFRVVVEGNVAQAALKVAATKCRCLILDLATPGLIVADVLRALPEANRPRVIAFGAHVQAARLQEARDAGCDEVMPRSKFSATLPDLLTRALHV
jgi:CheY-like chemotaxis protein